MENNQKSPLLPLGSQVEFAGYPLEIVKRLKAGLTGEVYEGRWHKDEETRHVAIKAMKALEFPMARQFFENEGATLATLMGWEDEVNQAQRTAFRVAPEYFGKDEYNQIPYLVMEFIEGVEIPELLETQQKFPEIQALVAAWQLYRTLDLLHTRLKKVYIDLKFEDLWWVGSPSAGQLKLTDFGTLEAVDERQRGTKRDVLLAGVFLCAMLTGETLNYLMGDLKESAEKIVSKHEKEISYGACRLLLRVLHRNPEARITTAAQAATELRALVNFWRQPLENTRKAGHDLLVSVENISDLQQKRDKGRKDAERARIALDIARLRLQESGDLTHDDSLLEEIERSDRFLEATDYLQSGKGLFMGRSYAMARQSFEDGRHWVENPAVMRRWAYLAQVGEEVDNAVFDPRRDEAFQMLDRLNATDWPHALERLELLAPYLKSPGWDYLRSDCQLFLALEKAEAAVAGNDFGVAAQAYRQAMHWLETLPDADLIRKEEIGDLRARLEEVEQRRDAEGRAAEFMNVARQMILDRDWDSALAKATEGLLLDRNNPIRLDDLTSLTIAAIHGFNFDAAEQIARLGRFAGYRNPNLRAARDLAASLRQVEVALERANRQAFMDGMWNIRARHMETARPAFWYLLETAVRLGAQARDDALLREVVALAESVSVSPEDHSLTSVWRRQFDEIVSERRAERQQAINNLLEQTDYWMALDDLDPSRTSQLAEGLTLAEYISRLNQPRKRLDKISSLLEQAETLCAETDGYRQSDLQTRRQKVSTASASLNDRQSLFTKNLEAEQGYRHKILQMRWERVIAIHEWLRHAPDTGAASTAVKAATESLQENLIALLRDCYGYLAEIDAGDETVQVFITEASKLRGLGKHNWAALQKTASDQIRAIEADFKAAQEAYQQGDSSFASAELDRLAHDNPDYRSTPEWVGLKDKLAQVAAWEAWQTRNASALKTYQANSPLLKEMRRYFHLPRAYWQTTINDYLLNTEDGAANQARQNLGSLESKEFLTALRDWLYIHWTMRLAESAGHSASNASEAWEADRFMRRACIAALEQGDRLQKLVHATQPPADIEGALNDLTPDAWRTIVWNEAPRVAGRRAEKQNRERNLLVIALALGSILLGCVVLNSGSLYYCFSNKEKCRQVAFGTNTPTITPSLTPSSTPTPLPTLTPSLTPTLTPTFTPTSTSTAQVNPSVIAGLYPPLPVYSTEVWVLNDDAAAVDPPLTNTDVWQEATSGDAGANGEKYYFTQVGNATVTWNLDVPLNAGLYQLFVIDPKANSGGYGPQPFIVKLDDQLAVPYRGQASIFFNTKGGLQAADDWLSIGIYQVQQDQHLAVQAVIPQLDSAATSFFALDRLLIVKVPEPDPAIPEAQSWRPLIDLLPLSRTVVSILDDSRAAFFPPNGAYALNEKYQGQTQTDVVAWNGSMRSLTWDKTLASAVGQSIDVNWAPLGRLPPGQYELLVFVPASHATVVADYTLVADGVVLKPDTPRQIAQQDFAGEWVSLNVWKLDKEAAVGVRMTIKRQDGLEIGIDAVALARVGE